MKVICIDAKRRIMDGPWAQLTEGQIYTVAEVRPSGGYRLQEYFKEHCLYHFSFAPDRFIPLSDIDETERTVIHQQDKVYH